MFEQAAPDSLREPHDLQHVINMFEALGDSAIFIGAVREDKIVGFIAAVCFPNLFTGVLEANEVLWFVDPAERGCGLQLFKLFEQWATDQGAKYATVCHMKDSMPDSVGGFYERVGYSRQDIIYRKEI